jgi:hypothetical protein
MKSFDARRVIATVNDPGVQVKRVQSDDAGNAGDASAAGDTVVAMPDRLIEWLADLRLLRHVPLAYLIPDPELLPPESIRFFYVDRTWTDRLIDGAMSAADIGTVDRTFTAAAMAAVRGLLDDELGLGAGTPISGMIIRSEVVERWPDLVVEALPTGMVSVLRQEVLARSIMIVLFAGVPTELHLREPHVGLRYGVEFSGGTCQVDARDSRGEPTATAPIRVHLLAGRVLNLDDSRRSPEHDEQADIKSLKGNLRSLIWKGKPPPDDVIDPIRSREIALLLRQRPYAARFKNDPNDPAPPGSQWPEAAMTVRVGGQDHPVRSILGAHARRILEGGK